VFSIFVGGFGADASGILLVTSLFNVYKRLFILVTFLTSLKFFSDVFFIFVALYCSCIHVL